MRVVITSRIFAPEPAAAAYRLAALAGALARSGAEVTVLTTRPPAGTAPEAAGWRAAEADDAAGAVRVRRAPVLRDASGQVRGYLQYLSFDVPLAFRLLFSRAADVVVTEPPPTTGFVVRVVCALRRRPYVYYAADIWSDAAESTGAPGFVVRAVRSLERRALRRARHVVAVTDGVADRVRALAGHDRVTVVRNGIDTRVFSPDGPTVEGPPTAVYAGTTSEWQGADVFVRAWPAVTATIPDAKLVFLGQGSAWDDLRELAEEVAPGAVEFHDLVPPAEAATRLRSAGAGLVSLKPGQGYDFAFPTKVYAALGCGTPVVYAGPGAAAEVIDRGDLGRAVDYDTDAVASAVVEVLRREPGADAERLAAWTARHASISSAAKSAADVVRHAAGGVE
ncbi:glycosyltransferase family 4 protein [Agromyces sp. H3Y2-19a]|uniref:glycosyltransferase family 4 protein n=1 Tax=Agromyces TaxID=33877 RepID=UPI0023B95B6D|nr:glycosyltransferase family 4 protein [Agromyces chromiiresistens]MDF0514634.1 glycosyltransferase family 4 protein [Agromyces chromiiresistens]